MLNRMPFRIFREWMRYAEKQPFGDQRADLRAGVIASVVANASSTKKSRKGRGPFKPSDFFGTIDPEVKAVRKTQDPETLRKKMFFFNFLLGGSVKRGQATDGD